MGYQVLEDNINFIDTNSNNPKVCFLHGWGRSSKDFKKISESFDYISFDLPGFGKSPAPKISLNPEEYANFVLDNLPKSVEIIVGHSFGGRVATYMSLKRKFSKLVLIGVPLIQNKNSSNKKGSLYYLKKLNKIGLISDQFIENYKNKKGSYDYRNASGIMREVLVKAVNDDLEPQLNLINTPVDLIWGSEDKEVPTSVATAANNMFPKSSLHILNNQGHNPLNSSYDEIINIIKG
jgi:pimeloyl-ACP methyl ester carboxylesterase